MDTVVTALSGMPSTTGWGVATRPVTPLGSVGAGNDVCTFFAPVGGRDGSGGLSMLEDAGLRGFASNRSLDAAAIPADRCLPLALLITDFCVFCVFLLRCDALDGFEEAVFHVWRERAVVNVDPVQVLHVSPVCQLEYVDAVS